MAERAWPANLALGIVLWAFGIQTVAAATFAVNIPAEPLPQALVELALQTQLSISDTGIDFHGVAGSAVSGPCTPGEALSKLLAGTGYTFKFVDASTVQITRLDAKPQPPVRSGATNPEIIVVTATKRAEIATALPYSLTLVTAPELADAPATSANGLTTEVPQLTATNLGEGQDKIFLRALTDSVVPGLSESVVGVYLDEVRVGDDTPDPDLQLIDIQRVEILNGPQGTLYGSGSLGGLVRIVTRQPEVSEFETAVSVSLAQTKDGALSDRIAAVLNIPLPDESLAVRTVAYAMRDSGYIDETRLGIPNANWIAISGGRAAAKWVPDGAWSIVAGVAYQQIHAGDAQYLQLNSGSLARPNYVLEPHADDFLEGSVTVDGDLGVARLVSATAAVDRQLAEQFDTSLAWPSLTGFPVGPSPFIDRRQILSFTNESRLVSKQDGRWKWLFGVFVSHREEDFQSTLSGPDNVGDTLIARSERRDDVADEAAVFGELTYGITGQLSVTAGVRAFTASRSVKANTASIFGDAGPFHGSNQQSNATPKFVASYAPSANWLIYGQVGEGYRLGGLNADGPPGSTSPNDHIAFDSDTLWNYEVGAKAMLLNGIVVASGAAYLDRWNNVQTDQIGRDGSFFILNAGDVRSLGTEADLTVGPCYNLTLRGNFFWNNAQLSHANALLVQSEGVLPAAPRTKFGLSARYDLPIRTVDAFVAADYGYVGKSHLGFDETAPSMGGYHITNLRLGLTFRHWEALLFIENLQREDENTFGLGNPFDPNPQVTPPRPRTVGLTINWHS